MNKIQFDMKCLPLFTVINLITFYLNDGDWSNFIAEWIAFTSICTVYFIAAKRHNNNNNARMKIDWKSLLSLFLLFTAFQTMGYRFFPERWPLDEFSSSSGHQNLLQMKNESSNLWNTAPPVLKEEFAIVHVTPLAILPFQNSSISVSNTWTQQEIENDYLLMMMTNHPLSLDHSTTAESSGEGAPSVIPKDDEYLGLSKTTWKAITVVVVTVATFTVYSSYYGGGGEGGSVVKEAAQTVVDSIQNSNNARSGRLVKA
jgi:hypothetical protein